MESWLQKDQDDGVVQRDMTSSLTGGDESFDSAHQNYQNSLIRNKKSENSGNPQSSPSGFMKMSGKLDPSPSFARPDMLSDNYYMNDYNMKYPSNEKAEVGYEEFENEVELPSEKYHSKLAYLKNQKDENPSLRFFNKMKGDKYMESMPSKEMMFNRMPGVPAERVMNTFSDDYGAMNKWNLCKRVKDSSSPPMNFLQPNSRDNVASGFMGYQAVEGQASNAMNNGPVADGKNPQVEVEYYDVDTSPVSTGEEDGFMDADMEHGFINKRDQGSRQLPQLDRMSTVRGFIDNPESAAAFLDALKAVKYKEAGMQVPTQTNVGTNSAYKDLSNGDIFLKMSDSTLDTRALQDVAKGSQRAIKEVQLFHQMKSRNDLQRGESSAGEDTFKREGRNIPGLNWNAKSLRFDEKRLKREDEDEQKNMKTGTDEGGGGEYEDEEGKGHKDEEEYYEDADLSEDEASNEDRHTTDDLNPKLVKREVKESDAMAFKRGDNDGDDYEFSLDNAPVENEQVRQSSLRDGGKRSQSEKLVPFTRTKDQSDQIKPNKIQTEQIE